MSTHPVLSCRVATLGCKVNQYESERVLQGLRRLGIEPAPEGAPADVYVVNTCGVTGVSEKKSRRLVRRLISSAPGAMVVVTGCYVDLAEGDLDGIPGVSLVVPNREKGDLPQLVAEALGIAPELGVGPDGGERPRARALLKVQDGCDDFCTYCAVPYARGAPRSRPSAEALAEARHLAEHGCREIVLTGVHLGKYGIDRPGLGSGLDLEGLVRSVLSQVPRVRVRLSSLEVGEFTPGLLEMLASEGRLCRHLHLPLQSGSDRVLARMGRPYTAAQYAQTVGEVLARVPGLAVTTDVMVGFPGETEEDFEQTEGLARSLGLARLHVFPFSARPGVPAATYPDQVSPGAKRARAARLRRLGEQLSRVYQGRFLGSSAQVVVEEAVTLRGQGYLVGHTGNYLKVLFPGPENLVGEVVPVMMERLADAGIIGVWEESFV